MQKKEASLLINNTKSGAESKFFLLKGAIHPLTTLVIEEIKKRNEAHEFISSFVISNGLPAWDKALISTSAKDTLIYIPLILEHTRFINGFIVANFKNGIIIRSQKASDYKKAPHPDEFVTLLMYFENTVFKTNRFIITDTSIYLPYTTTIRSHDLKLKDSYIKRGSTGSVQTLTISCELFTIFIDWLKPDPPNCTCYDPTNCDWATGCPDCSNSFSTHFTYTVCGGDGGGGSYSTGGEWSPEPPAGGGGGNTIAPSGGYLLFPNTEEYLNFINYSLSPTERSFWDDYLNSDFVSVLIRKLVHGNYTTSTVSDIQFWIDYLINTPDITAAEFENYFGPMIDEQDGSYDSNYWDNPNLWFQSASLPSLQAFSSAFPKIVNADNTISYMPSGDVYTLVGGNMNIQNKLPNQSYQNACAIRGSRAFNYCGQPIDNSATATELGNDGKKYILNAKAFNKYMNKKYGSPTYRLSRNQINNNPDNIKNFLRGKSGIYSMVTSGGSFSGHVDLILNGICLSGSATGNISNVEFIEIWELK